MVSNIAERDGQAEAAVAKGAPPRQRPKVRALLPRADRPTRWDLPGGSLMDVIDSFKRMVDMRLTSIVPLQGPAIRGSDHVLDVLKRHLDFFESAAANDGQPPPSWDRPAPTAVWLTPRTPWPLDETETV